MRRQGYINRIFCMSKLPTFAGKGPSGPFLVILVLETFNYTCLCSDHFIFLYKKSNNSVIFTRFSIMLTVIF
jgi:hypothetical protein